MDGRLHMEIQNSVSLNLKKKPFFVSDPYASLILTFSMSTNYCFYLIYEKLSSLLEKNILKYFNKCGTPQVMLLSFIWHLAQLLLDELILAKV